jgi:pimeloyl-ACP methyl ester carboxylesterase
MTTVHAPISGALNTTWQNVPTHTINGGGVEFAYRQLGPRTGVPVVFLTHLAAVLDNWDPRVVDGIAAKHRVITFDNRGVGASSGATPATIEEMARDAVAFIRALGFDQVDLFGLSMGGMIAQVIAQQQPQLVRKMIIAGTGPAGGEGIDKVTRITYLDTARGLLTRQDPKQVSFLHHDPERAPRRQGVPGTAGGTYQRPRQGHLRALVPRPAQGHPPMGSADARGSCEHPPAGACDER